MKRFPRVAIVDSGDTYFRSLVEGSGAEAFAFASPPRVASAHSLGCSDESGTHDRFPFSDGADLERWCRRRSAAPGAL